MKKKQLELKDFKDIDINTLHQGAKFLFGASAPPFQPPTGSLFDVEQATVAPTPAPVVLPKKIKK